MESRAVLVGLALAPVAEAGRGDIGVPKPFLHSRKVCLKVPASRSAVSLVLMQNFPSAAPLQDVAECFEVTHSESPKGQELGTCANTEQLEALVYIGVVCTEVMKAFSVCGCHANSVGT